MSEETKLSIRQVLEEFIKFVQFINFEMHPQDGRQELHPKFKMKTGPKFGGMKNNLKQNTPNENVPKIKR